MTSIGHLKPNRLRGRNTHLIRDGIQCFLAVARQVRALGQILANQTVDIFVTTALPRAVRVTEIDRNPSFF